MNYTVIMSDGSTNLHKVNTEFDGTLHVAKIPWSFVSAVENLSFQITSADDNMVEIRLLGFLKAVAGNGKFSVNIFGVQGYKRNNVAFTVRVIE
jgi:hypothetical protein